MSAHERDGTSGDGLVAMEPVGDRVHGRRLQPGWVILGVMAGMALVSAGAIAQTIMMASPLEDVAIGIPYEGFLTLDDQPAEGTFLVTFTLHGGATCTDCQLWTEARSVNVRRGRFAVKLGEVSALADTVLDAEHLYLAMDVEGVGLTGRQALAPIPWVHVAAHAASVRLGSLVAGTAGPDLDIEGDLRVRGATMNVGTTSARMSHGANDTLNFAGNQMTVRANTKVYIEGLATLTGLQFPYDNFNNAGNVVAGKVLSQRPAISVTAAATAPFYTLQATEQWADCGNKVIQAVRLVRDSTTGRMDLQVKCKP